LIFCKNYGIKLLNNYENMSEIVISNHIPKKQNKIEFIERKGYGHPDTLSDGLAERLSAKYSQYTLKNFGVILHHNFDKVGLLGGSSFVKFGKGKIINPIRVLLNGRASTKFGKTIIPVEKLLTKWTQEFMKERLPLLNPKKDLIFHYNLSSKSSPGKTDELASDKGTRKFWFEPRGLHDLQEARVLLANDTSLGVGFYPLSNLENLILDIENSLYYNFSKKNLWLGSDIKILAFFDGYFVRITMCLPQIANYVKSQLEYKKNIEIAKKYILAIVKKHKFDKVSLDVNTRDNFELNELYLTAIGSSIESGDEGLVGRGNRVNGLITPMRPMSMEGACGKNPVYHIGKIYYLAANIIAKKIYNKYGVYCEVYIASQSGRGLIDPWIISVFLPENFKKIKDVKLFLQKEIASIPGLTPLIINESLNLY